MAAAAGAGSYFAPRVARKLGGRFVRYVVIAIGFGDGGIIVSVAPIMIGAEARRRLTNRWKVISLLRRCLAGYRAGCVGDEYYR